MAREMEWEGRQRGEGGKGEAEPESTAEPEGVMGGREGRREREGIERETNLVRMGG